MAASLSSAAAAAARRLATSGRLPKLSFFLGVRREGGMSGDEIPSAEEIKKFVLSFKSFLEKAEAGTSQESFGNLLKDLSSSIHTVAQKSGILYPTELSNLVATHVPVLGTYMPHNSKVVIVDMEKRLVQVEMRQKADDERRRSSIFLKNGAALTVVTAVIAAVAYWPFVIHKLELEDKNLTDKLEDEKSKVVQLEVKVKRLDASHSELELKNKCLADKLEEEESKVVQLEVKVKALDASHAALTNRVQELRMSVDSDAVATSREDGAWTGICVGAAGVGVTISCVIAYLWLK